MTIPVRLAYRWLSKLSGSFETGQPTALMMTLTILVVFGSAFFTDVIGIHAIFVCLTIIFPKLILYSFQGGFLAGLIIPHENSYAINVVEKLEDLVSILFLPLVRMSSLFSHRRLLMKFQYFALSGLSTNLGLLNNGITWGYVVLICVIAFFSKFLGCSITARLFGFSYRESGAIGALMSCKG